MPRLAGGVVVGAVAVGFVGGGLLLLAGLRFSVRSPWPAAILISLAVAGALPTFWTVIASIAALTLVVLSIV